MEKYNLELRLQEINNNINILKKEKKVIETQLKELNPVTTEDEKLLIWFKSKKGKHLNSVFELERTCPLTYKNLNVRDLNRYKTYHFKDYFEDEFYVLFQATKQDLEDDDIDLTEYKVYKDIAIELMNANVKSFECDW